VRRIVLWLYSFALGGAVGGGLFGAVRSARYRPVFHWSGYAEAWPAVYINLLVLYAAALCIPVLIRVGLRNGRVRARRRERLCPACAYPAGQHCTECGWHEGDRLRRRSGFLIATLLFFLAPVLVSVPIELHFSRLDRQFATELAQAMSMTPPAKLVHWRPWPWNWTYLESLPDGSVHAIAD
jgi:hypothetical protein